MESFKKPCERLHLSSQDDRFSGVDQIERMTPRSHSKQLRFNQKHEYKDYSLISTTWTSICSRRSIGSIKDDWENAKYDKALSMMISYGANVKCLNLHLEIETFETIYSTQYN